MGNLIKFDVDSYLLTQMPEGSTCNRLFDPVALTCR